MSANSIVGRLAPSPTGLLHVGHARTFVLAWLHLRGRGGRVLMRMEDLDAERAKPGFDDAILRDLEWLGLDWDGEVDVQSRSRSALDVALERLVADGHVYPCVCTRKEIEAAQSAPHAGDEETAYPGTCRDRFRSLAEAREITGRDAALRFRVEPGEVTVIDGIAGELTQDVASTVGDFPVAKKDGAAAYQLAVVVDDARQGVTEVHRGDDLLASTPRQFLLQEALSLGHPRWFHFPLVVDDDGRRLAKRHDSLSLAALRESGIDPRRLVQWIAESAGIECEGAASPSDLVGRFDVARLPGDPVRFGERELASLS